jgi:mannose-6-phosphate isomerase-like protein (cupin superfamily)
LEIVNINTVKKTKLGVHGGALFQRVLGRGTHKPDLMESFRALVKITIPPGEANTLHTHENEEQIYIILQGRGKVQVGEKKSEVKAGDVVYLPAKLQHGLFNTSDKPCVLLNVGAQTEFMIH